MGPLLFVVYVNDLPNVFLHTIATFYVCRSDDTKCLKRNKEPADPFT